jgi:methyltransferase-like protein
MSIIYALVARGSDSVLCSYSPHQGNFEQVAFDVLKRLKPSQKYGQYATAHHNFYSYCIDGYIFMVMAETEVENAF